MFRSHSFLVGSKAMGSILVSLVLLRFLGNGLTAQMTSFMKRKQHAYLVRIINGDEFTYCIDKRGSNYKIDCNCLRLEQVSLAKHDKTLWLMPQCRMVVLADEHLRWLNLSNTSQVPNGLSLQCKSLLHQS